MLERAKVVAMLATADASRARAFYAGVLGLTLIAEDRFALIFDANGVTLRIAKVREVAAPPYTALGWEVDDIDATVDALAARGVRFERFAGLDQDGRGVWDAPGGGRIAWFRDPDGNLLSLTE
ncbi:MAG TPA: VOC family protein [Dehalococcoidia bacterium]|nr:VOC family protein [Dehalococcoidia bacterium]